MSIAGSVTIGWRDPEEQSMDQMEDQSEEEAEHKHLEQVETNHAQKSCSHCIAEDI